MSAPLLLCSRDGRLVPEMVSPLIALGLGFALTSLSFSGGSAGFASLSPVGAVGAENRGRLVRFLGVVC